MEKKVSDLIADFLEEKGIDTVFGIIGSGNAHIFDSIASKGYTEIVCVHHEQAAVMAMGTYFRTCGKISATLVTTGAGSTNAITGVVSTWMDSVPGIIISGNENSKFTTAENPLRIWGVQGYDCVQMVEKVTKYASRVMDPNTISAELHQCHDVSLAGRPGPVWLDVPMNVQAAKIQSEELTPYTPETPAKTNPTELSSQIDDIVKLLEKAERPLIWLGHGIRLAGGQSLIGPLLDQLNSPALVTWNGADMIASDHPKLYGRAGVYGQRYSNFVLQNCDLLVTIGTRLAMPQVGYDISELARAAKVIVVDNDQAELEKYPTRFDMTLCMDAKDFIVKLQEAHKGSEVPARKEWFDTCDGYKKKHPIIDKEHADPEGFINSYKFMDKLCDHLRPNDVIVTDMGTALLSGHQVIRIKDNQRLMTSTGLGEMGHGLPAAIGASFAGGRSEVICLNCDGGMMMNLQELQTIAHHQLPIKVFIFNNDGYLMIKHTQKALFKGRYASVDKKTGVTCPDFSALAKAFKFESFQIRTWEDFDSELPKTLEAKGPVFCEVFMHPEQFFLPKLGLAPQKDGSIISPPLEDLSPFIPREEMKENMIIGMHPKSEGIDS